jgi:hypothetical protein
MDFTNNSKRLISFFLEKKYIHLNRERSNKYILSAFNRLYQDIQKGEELLRYKKMHLNMKLNAIKIQSAKQIPKPKTFVDSDMPSEIVNHIHNSKLYSFEYTFSLFHKTINVYFIIQQETYNLKTLKNRCNAYVDMIIIWLYLVNQYSASFHSCSKSLSLFLYLTSKEKSLPDYSHEIINQEHVNSGFTRTCVANSEIVIFRKEEWFKVLIHETFHNFAMDFSDMHQHHKECHNKILSMFPIQSDVNLFEAYTEFWARIINIAFCSNHITNRSIAREKKNADVGAYLHQCEILLNIEKSYALFQMVKVLQHMGLTYCDLYMMNKTSQERRTNNYREKTNILAYHIITTLLLQHSNDFLGWCYHNNSSVSLLQFKKTREKLHEFCEFIRKKYKNASIIKSIEYMENQLVALNKKRPHYYILKNLRMTICEME